MNARPIDWVAAWTWIAAAAGAVGAWVLIGVMVYMAVY